MSDPKPIFVDQNLIVSSAEETCLFDQNEINALLKARVFPDSVEIKAYDPNDKADLASETWVCFLHYPFSIGMSYPFPPLVNQFFATTKLCYSQAMPMVWRILHLLCQLNENKGLGIGLPEIAASYQLRTHGSSRFVLQSRVGKRQMIPRSSHNDFDWKRKFFFVKRSSIPEGKELPVFWVKKAAKFEDLVKPNEDTGEKLKLLYQIPDRERACFSEIATSEASFSADHTPSMSSVPSAKFSFQDIKSKVLKKEKCEETPVSKPAPAPAPASAPSTRSVKRRKAINPIIHLDSFEGLSADEIKEKTLSLQSTANLGIGQLHQLLKKRESDLLDLQKLMDHKDGHYKQREELLTKEVKELAVLNEKLVAENGELKVRAEEEKRLMIEEAQNSAASSVYEAMFEMAKEAAAAGFSLPQWDAYGWDLHLGKPEETAQADSQAAETAEDDGKKVVEEGAGTPVGDEGVMQA